MSDPYVLLWLEAPLQAWGYDSKFGRRETLDFPTKSGLLGLIFCALGAGGQQKQRLAIFADLDLQIMAYKRITAENKPAGREPFLRDFHMVGSGYNISDPWQNLLVPKKNDGSKAVGGGTKITYRYYIQDMAFAAAVQVPARELKNVATCLKQPVWEVYLGRKTCAPTEYVFQGEFKTADKAFQVSDSIAREKNRIPEFRVLQGEHDGDENFTLNDVPVQFGPEKIYHDRRVTLIRQD